MTALEVPQISTDVYIPDGMNRLRFPYDAASDIEITMGTSDHPLFRAARQMEHDTFVSLNDRPAPFPTPDRDEFLKYNPFSVVTYAELVPRSDNSDTIPRLMGMNRFIPHTPELGIKTVTDLAELPTRTQDLATRDKVVEALLHKGSAECTEEEIAPEALEKVILDRLCRENGSCDPSTLIDIATLAPDMTLEHDQKMPVINALLGATTIYLLRAKLDLDHTGTTGYDHYLQFTDRHFAHLMRSLGYPSDPISGLAKVLYDTDGDGIAMVANPQITAVETLRKSVMGADPASHLGAIATIYRRHFGQDI